MSWLIPAKTFLLGEYVALQGGPAILLTTTPCFEVSLQPMSSAGFHAVPSQAPAARYWSGTRVPGEPGLMWRDPYAGVGGLGASSAQFVGAFCARAHLNQQPVHAAAMLAAYRQYAWTGEGMPPSGYDVWAQTQRGCVFLNKQTAECIALDWPFDDLAFILIHTGHKLATHEHLNACAVPDDLWSLHALVFAARAAFEHRDSQQLVHTVRAYGDALLARGLVAPHTQQQRIELHANPDILVSKGCGALGADVLLALVAADKAFAVVQALRAQGRMVLATSHDLHYQAGLLAI